MSIGVVFEVMYELPGGWVSFIRQQRHCIVSLVEQALY